MPHTSRSLKNLFFKGADIEILRSPELDSSYQSNIKGIHIIGDLTGVPLLKNAVNMGQELIDEIASGLKNERLDDEEMHLLIVGAGGAGLAAALAAKDHGLKYIVLEQKKPGATIHNFFKGKDIFAEPASVPNKSKLWVQDSKKEELLEHWEEILDSENLNIVTNAQVAEILKEGNGFKVATTQGMVYKGRRVVLAMGRSGNPRMLNIPGEELPKAHHIFVDPEIFIAKKLAIVGGGDASIEAALALSPYNHVTLIVRSAQITRALKKNIDRLESAVSEGRISLLLESKVTEIDQHELKLDVKGEQQTIENDEVFILIGSDPPDEFLKKLTIRNIGDWSFKRAVYLVVFAALIFFLYGWKSGKFYPFNSPEFSWLYEWSDLKNIFSGGLYPSMWFGFIYSIVITGFGIKALRRYRKDKYQVTRYTILILSQIILFWIIPEWIFQVILKVDSGWRAYGLFYPAPLYLWNFWNPGSAHLFWFIWSVLLTVVGVPLMAAIWGKKYCAYVCSCGGLAETLGDSFRTLSPRGRKSRAWENLLTYLLLVLAALVIAFGLHDKDSGWWTFQQIVVDFALAGVVGVAAYPFWGNRIWCRFLCPLAKLLYIFAKDNSRVKISTGEHCIRCTLCSKYCQMGIPVMEFAKRNEDFSNQDSSCIQCGICITVCPVRNLQHGDWSEASWKEEIEQGPPINVK